MKQTFVALLFILASGLVTLSQANDLTLSGDVGITGPGNGLTFPDGTKQVTANPPANLVLECVSAIMWYEVDSQPDYCEDPYSLLFTCTPPSGLEPEDVFSVYCETPNPYDTREPVSWGLRCQEGWMNTGCSSQDPADVSIHENGCHSDNEEYGSRLYAVCCRIAIKTE